MLNLPQREPIASFSFNQVPAENVIENYIKSRQFNLIEFCKSRPNSRVSSRQPTAKLEPLQMTDLANSDGRFTMPSPINNEKQFSQRTLSDSIMQDTMIDDIMNPKLTPVSHTKMQKLITEGGQTKINQYTISRTLGRGSFAKVKLASDNLNQYAIKICDRKKLKLKLLTSKVDAYLLLDREIAIMKKVQHENVVRLVEVIENPNNDKLYLVIEFMDGPELLSRQFTADEIWNMFRGFMKGLDYLHNYANIAHMDIKPENLLLDSQMNLKIADFGVAQIMDDDIVQQKLGTTVYQPPEIGQDKVKGKPIDIWAAGLTLYQLVYRKLPLRANLIAGTLTFDSQSDLVDLMQKMLNCDPLQRITAAQTLKHPWITRSGKQPLSNIFQGIFKIEQQDIQNAVTRLSINMAFRAVNKMKGLENAARNNDFKYNQMKKSGTNILDREGIAANPDLKKIFKNELVLLSSKVYKYNDAGKQQERVILVTNFAIYNLLPANMVSSFMQILNSSARVKRKISLDKIHAITISRFGFEFVLHVPNEYDYRFSSIDFRDQILIAICGAFLQLTKQKQMAFYFKDDMVLQAFATTKKLKAEKQNRMPIENPTLLDVEGLRQAESQKMEAQIIYQQQNKQTMSIDDFQVVKVLGRGSFGKVMLCEHKKSRELYAIKSLNKEVLIQKDQIEHTKTEREILTRVNHPFLIQLQWAFQTESKLFFVMPFIQGGELFQHMRQHKRFPEEWIKFYAAQLVLAIEYLHELQYVYRDLKPENILVNKDGYIILTDFGLAKKLKKNEFSSSFVGTPDYLAPETVMNQNSQDHDGHNHMVDWWSLGVIMYEMAVGITPFYHENQKKMMEQILTKDVRFPNSLKLSEAFKDIVVKLLTKNHEKRLGAKKSSDVKQHAFFIGYSFEDVFDKLVQPPFLPVLNDRLDVQNFDQEYTSENPQFSMINQNEVLVKQFDVEFQGMSYQQGL